MRFIIYIFLFQISFLSTTDAQLTLTAESQSTTTGSTISIPIYLNPSQLATVLGFQFTLNWDDNLLDYQSISHFGIAGLDSESFGTPQLTNLNNSLIVTWENYPNTFTITENTALFHINFNVKTTFTSGTTDIRFCTDCAMEFLDENITDFNISYQNGQVTVSSLPIELLEFNAKTTDDSNVQLTWSTATETNNSHFEIEHSTDAKDWKILGKVASKGTSTIQQNYQYLDQNPLVGENFYRLKQVDANGEYTHSATRMVDIEKAVGVISWMNPVQDKLQLTYETITEKGVSFEIYSTTGKLISTKNFDLLVGKNQLEWDVQHLPNGTYWVKEVGQTTTAFKIIKQ